MRDEMSIAIALLFILPRSSFILSICVGFSTRHGGMRSNIVYFWRMSIASFGILMVKKRSIVVKIETILERNRQTNSAGRFQAWGRHSGQSLRGALSWSCAEGVVGSGGLV